MLCAQFAYLLPLEHIWAKSHDSQLRNDPINAIEQHFFTSLFGRHSPTLCWKLCFGLKASKASKTLVLDDKGAMYASIWCAEVVEKAGNILRQRRRFCFVDKPVGKTR